MTDSTWTQVYGTSDDLIEIEGGLIGEHGAYGTNRDDSTLIVLSDGTLLAMYYGKPGLGGVWGIDVVRKGSLFERLDVCTDEEAGRYSDTVWLKPGVQWAFAAAKWAEIS